MKYRDLTLNPMSNNQTNYEKDNNQNRAVRARGVRRLDWFMAKLSTFLGIILSMDKEDCQRHKGAHIHAWYSGYAASFDARTGKMLAKGKNGFPAKQAGWIKTWIEINEAEIAAAWELLKRGINPPEIAPLQH